MRPVLPKTKWQVTNKEKWDAYLKNRRARVVRTVIAMKFRPCFDCRGWFNPWQMDFDHIRGVKKFSLGQAGTKGVRTILAEIAKCELVCANCHRERTHKRGEYKFYARKN